MPPRLQTCLTFALIALQVLTLYTLIRLVAALDTLAAVLSYWR